MSHLKSLISQWLMKAQVGFLSSPVPAWGRNFSFWGKCNFQFEIQYRCKGRSDPSAMAWWHLLLAAAFGSCGKGKRDFWGNCWAVRCELLVLGRAEDAANRKDRLVL